MSFLFKLWAMAISVRFLGGQKPRKSVYLKGKFGRIEIIRVVYHCIYIYTFSGA